MSEERLWTTEEIAQLRAAHEGPNAIWTLGDLLAQERRRAIELAKEMIGYNEVNAKEPGWKMVSLKGPEDAVDWLLSLGLLERHPERDWYRWREEK